MSKISYFQNLEIKIQPTCHMACTLEVSVWQKRHYAILMVSKRIMSAVQTVSFNLIFLNCTRSEILDGIRKGWESVFCFQIQENIL